jgi:hypothetical protein
MDKTPGEIDSDNGVDELSYDYGSQDVYEISLDSCRHLVGWPGVGWQPDWFYEGMINSVKPMWALRFGRQNGRILGFVWDTKTSLPQVTSQDVIGVRCELWETWSIFQFMTSEQRTLFKDSRNFLGKTTLSMGEIWDKGFFPQHSSTHSSNQTSPEIRMSPHCCNTFSTIQTNVTHRDHW